VSPHDLVFLADLHDPPRGRKCRCGKKVQDRKACPYFSQGGEDLALFLKRKRGRGMSSSAPSSVLPDKNVGFVARELHSSL